MLNVATKPTNLPRPAINPSAWRGDVINKSHSQANLPLRNNIEVRSKGSQESNGPNQELESIGDYVPGHFNRRKIKSNALMYPPSSDKKKESTDHKKVSNYLEVQRNKRFGERKLRNQNTGGYVSNFTNYDDLKSDSAQSLQIRQAKPVNDHGLRKILADTNITETERMNAVKIRTE